MVDKIEINKLYIQSDSQKDSDLELSNTPSYIFHNKETKIINNYEINFRLGNTKTTPESKNNNYINLDFDKDIIEQNKPYEDNCNMVISKKIFEIKKISKIEKLKDLLLKKRSKIGYLTHKKSKRSSNIEDMIVRNIIQEIIPDWINVNETNKRNILVKIKPSILRDTDFFKKNKDKLIGEFYILEITEKVKNQKHNIEIIEKADNDKMIKLKFSLMEVFTAFNDINSREEILISKKPILLNENEIEKKAYIEKFYLGLKNKEEYINEKGGNEKYQEKLKKKLNELSEENYSKNFK